MHKGEINQFPSGIVPDEIHAIFLARWMNGAVTLDWLIQHPDWYDWIELSKVAFEQAMEIINKQQ